MTKKVSLFRVFVASPDNMKQERERLPEVIDYINRTSGEIFNFKFDLIRWESHGYPAVGVDAQDVLNQQLPDDYEIFIGLMWDKFGTPTGRAGSGTEEEFDRAYKRFHKDPSSVKIMFYFKETPLSPGAIDLEQYGRVRRFKDSLPEKGSLYWTFETEEEFVQLVRQHLFFVSHDLIKPPKPPDESRSSNPIDKDENPEEELGIFDYAERWEETISQLDAVTRRIGDDTEEYNLQLRERTVEIQDALDKSPGQISKKRARRLLGNAANTMEQFVGKVSENIPEFDDNLREAATSAAQMVRIITNSKLKEIEDMENLYEELRSLNESISFARSGMEDLQISIQDTPPMTRELNKATRKSTSILQQLIDSMAAGEVLFNDTLMILRQEIDRQEDQTDE